MDSIEETVFNARDLEVLPSDKQPYTLLSWLSSLSDDLASRNDITGDQQHHIAQQLSKILAFVEKCLAQAGCQLGSRALRHAIGKVYQRIYSSDHTKDLYETANELLSAINSSGRSEKAPEYKHFAVVSLGYIYSAAGSKIVSIAPLAATSIVKNLKSSSVQSGAKYSYLVALSRVSQAASDTFDDSVSKDIWKQCRVLVLDKSAKVAAAAFDVKTSILTNKLMFKTPSDFENLKTVVVKCLDSPYQQTRQAAARCFAQVLKQLAELSLTKKEAMLSATQTVKTFGLRRANTLPAKSKGKKGDAEEDDEDTDKSKTASPKAPKPIPFYSISFADCLAVLSTIYTHPSSSARVKVGLVETYSYLFSRMSPGSLEKRYSEIATHILINICGNTNINSNEYRNIMARKHAYFLINNVMAGQHLGEFGRMSGAKLLCNEILNNFDPNASTSNFNKNTFSATLACIGGLVEYLGSAISPIVDRLKECLDKLLLHPSYIVKVASCKCYKQILKVLPSSGIPTLSSTFEKLQRELSELPNKRGNRQTVIGYAYLTSIIVSLTNSNPQYSSLDLTNRIFTTGTALLKSNGNVDVVSIQVQVGWLLVSGVMALGPTFSKVHLSQLLLLWKNAFQKTGKDAVAGDRGALELNYLLHVRHYGLTSLVSFLAHNSKLITLDVARRISTMVQQTQKFLASIPSKRFTEDQPSQKVNKSLSLENYDLMIKRRILQCYVYLAQNHHIGELFPANALTASIQIIADPERNIRAKLSAAIAAGTGVIDSVWESADNYAFGLTTKVRGFDLVELRLNAFQRDDVKEEQETHWLSEVNSLDKLELELKQPILEATEFDADQLIIESFSGGIFKYAPVSSSVVDLSIDLFATIFPLQTMRVQESILEQLWNYVMSVNSSSQQSVAQKRQLRGSAVLVNAITTVHGALRFAMVMKDATKSANEDPLATQHFESYKKPRVLKAFAQITKLAISSSDPYVRNIAAQSMGMLSSIGGSAATSEHIKYLIDQIVANTDPNARGGCSVSLGYMMKYVGGVFAGLHLKTVLGILVSLANDPHPVVHFWALEAISLTIGSSGLGFAPYSSSVLSTLFKLYLMESHGDEVPSTTSNNLNTLWPTTTIIARCVGALVNILGPDLQESSKSQQYVLVFIRQFSELDDADYRITLVKLRMLQELAIFCPDKVLFKEFSRELHHYLMTTYGTPIRRVAIEGLNQLIRTRSHNMFSLLDKKFEKDIWIALDSSYGEDNKNIQRFLDSWLEQSAVTSPSDWIVRTQEVLMKPRSYFVTDKQAETVSAEPTEGDAGDEGASFAGSAGDSSNSPEGIEPLRWQTRAEGIVLLLKLLKILLQGKSVEEKEVQPVTPRIGDIVKIAFSASTAPVLELRLLGLKLLNQVINEFKDLTDPDFQEVALLEQYQAQIGSALTPAFSADSSPDLAFEAVRASATFIGSGIIKTADRMGRILKLLTDALDSCQGPHLSLGELKIPSSNSQFMLRIAVLSLWAELQVASVSGQKEYLIEIVQPHVPVLIPLWITSLKEFSRLRFEPEQSGTTLAGSLDQMYFAVFRTNMLPICERSWLQLVDAIASLIEQDRQLVFDILDERERVPADGKHHGDITYSSEPAAFFFVLFGLCFEALVRPVSNGEEAGYRLKVLIALKRILHRSVCGDAVYKEVIFAETVDMLDRIVLTGDAKQLAAVISIAHTLCMSHPSQYVEGTAEEVDDEDEEISEGVGQLFELFRVVILALTSVMPFLTDSPVQSGQRYSLDDPLSQSLIRGCLDYVVDMIGVFPNIIKTDLYACLLYVFGHLFEDDNCQRTVVSHCLHIQKKLFQMMMQTRESSESTRKVIDEEIAIAMAQNTAVLKLTDSTELGLIKRRNSLLWVVVAVTTCAKALNPNSSYVTDLSQILVESIRIPQLSSMVAGCIQSILVVTADTDVGRTIGEKLLPALVLLAISEAGSHEGTEEDEENKKKKKKTENNVSKLIINLLVGFTLSLKEDKKVVAALGLVIPVLLYCLENASEASQSTIKDYVNGKVFDLAGIHVEPFKLVVQNGLSSKQRELLQAVLQAQVVTQQQEEEIKPETHIQLKSFGA